MSKSRGRASGGQRDHATEETGENERQLELLAIEERFAAEHEAGRAPRLAEYAAAYPEHAAALANFVAEYLDDESRRAPEAPEAPFSAGTQRALDLLFPDGPSRVALRVAETARAYGGPRGRLRALARERDLGDDALAAALALTPELAPWLDEARGASEAPPAAAVARLAEALGVAEADVRAALGEE